LILPNSYWDILVELVRYREIRQKTKIQVEASVLIDGTHHFNLLKIELNKSVKPFTDYLELLFGLAFFAKSTIRIYQICR